GIRVAPAVTIQGAKALADGSASDVKSLRGKVVTAVFPDCVYVQEQNSPFGIKLVTSASVTAGEEVDVCGVMRGSGSERYLDCTGNPVMTTSPGPGVPGPFAAASSALGGAELNSFTPGVVGGIGPNNIGSFVIAFGKVTQRKTSAPKYFYIDDGCAIGDGTDTGGVENVGMRIAGDPASYAEGSYVFVMGVVSCFDSAGLRPQILPTEIQILRGP
ncbi:MAG: hypothetical protein Q7T82_10050, partial [Armatimonadota bacterium]|nr:hypothetical protein [Armatimonadota bacterium]